MIDLQKLSHMFKTVVRSRVVIYLIVFRLLYTAWCSWHILLQLLLLVLMDGSLPNGCTVFRIKFKFSTSFAINSLCTASRYRISPTGIVVQERTHLLCPFHPPPFLASRWDYGANPLQWNEKWSKVSVTSSLQCVLSFTRWEGLQDLTYNWSF